MDPGRVAPRRRFRRNAGVGRAGFSLMEILIVLSILTFLLTMAGTSYLRWTAKARVEDDTKRIYMDLMGARARALQQSRAAFVTMDGPGRLYRTYLDTSPAPDGNGILEIAEDRRITEGRTSYPFTPFGTTIRFRRDGIAQDTGTIRMDSPVDSDYDCITIQTTRIKMGRFVAGTCAER